MNIRVLLVDDHAMVRSGLQLLIDAQTDMSVVGEAADGLEAVARALELKPDVVLMDLSMPGGRDGLHTTAELTATLPDTKILILTMHDDEQYLFRGLKAGASGYILKSSPGAELLKAIRQVHQGQAYLHPSAAKRVIQGFLQSSSSGEKEPSDSYELLSEREREIFGLTAKGYTNKEMADMLSISAKTVENHKSHIMDKLGLSTRRDLMRYAIKRGLLDFED